MRKRGFALAALALLGLVQPAAALAHDGASLGSSFADGLLHPIKGVDHLAAMLAIGLLSVVLSRGAVWRLPLAFLTALVLGGVAGFAGFALIGTELWIIGSLVVMGCVLALLRPVDLRAALLAAALFGFAHGNAHGLELPIAADPAAYAGGFALASTACHLTGILIGLTVMRSRWSADVLRAGGATLIGGAALLLLGA